MPTTPAFVLTDEWLRVVFNLRRRGTVVASVGGAGAARFYAIRGTPDPLDNFGLVVRPQDGPISIPMERREHLWAKKTGGHTWITATGDGVR